MSHLRKMLRLLAVAVLAAAGSVAVASTAAGAQKPLAGLDRPALAALCERFQGSFTEKLPPPHHYGCDLPDGWIGCLETTQCALHRLDDRPPFQESCERGRGKYVKKDVATFSCWTEQEEILVVCDRPWAEDCSFGSTPHEQPMPQRFR